MKTAGQHGLAFTDSAHAALRPPFAGSRRIADVEGTNHPEKIFAAAGTRMKQLSAHSADLEKKENAKVSCRPSTNKGGNQVFLYPEQSTGILSRG